jgi:two-component system, cell cycle sensor histidine kinase and response regulator CckA
MAERPKPANDESPTGLPNDSLVPLEAILCTEELNRRPARPPDYETENRALAALVQALADSPGTILQTLAEKILEVFKADSAGISLLTKEDGGKRFYWPAIAGVWKSHIGGGTPRDFGPCGDVLDRNAALLFRHFERRYTYFLPVTPPVEECLLVPFYVEGKAVGTIWAIAHDDRRKFDAEDLRQLESLGRFASAAYQAVEVLDASEQQGKALGQSHTELAQRIAELQKTNTEAQNSRRAALNLMEDAVQSRRAMEKLNVELRESEERFRSLVSVITDVPWVTDATGAFITPQSAWEAYTGQTWEEHRGFRWVNALHADDRERVKEIWNEACASRTLYQSEGRLWHAPTQRWRYFIAKATPLLNADGSVREWIGTYTDVDEQKRSQEWLETTVADRTRELQQANAALLRDMEERKKLEEQLLQAQKMESIGTLAGGIAHDFNNILNIVHGYASLLGKRSADKDQFAESLEAISEAVQRGAGMVRQLLTLGRKTAAHLEPTDANGIIIGLTKLFEEIFPKTIELTLDLSKVPLVMADANQMNQIILNLCINARDAMPQGGKLLLKTDVVSGTELRQRFNQAQEERYLRVRVGDTGIGMDAETRSRIFEPFFTTKEHGQGTGLGLSVVYGIISNHAGFIDLTSEVDQGTTFDIYLPLPKDELRLIEIKQQLDEGRKVHPGAGATVLFADDEIIQRRLMEKVLEREGYKVLGASDGAEAVEMHLRHKDEIAIVILDLQLPTMNGWEAFQMMRKTQPKLKALFATGFASPEIEAELAKGEIAGIIMKPYELDEVLKKISEILQEPPPSFTESDLSPPKSSQVLTEA